MAPISYPQRKPLRLSGFDYRAKGAYFVTICTKDRVAWFCREAIVKIFMEEWTSLPDRIPGAKLDAFVVMPNHIHFLLWMGGDKSTNPPISLGEAMRQLKAVVARRVRLAGFPGFAWQRNYYEHIVRGNWDVRRVRDYIRKNAALRETGGAKADMRMEGSR